MGWGAGLMADRGLGLVVATESERSQVWAIEAASAPVVRSDMPPALDPREWLRITDQGRFNSCCGCAVDKALEWDAWVGAGQRVDLSARMSYLAAQQWAGVRNGTDRGVSIEAGAMGAHTIGTVLEEEFPYWGDRFDSTLPASALAGQNVYRVGAIARARSVAEIVDRLGSGQGATVFGVTWTTALQSFRGPARLTRPPTGFALGGHAICACGYERHDGQLFVRVWNSHGADWGDRGTFLVAETVLDYWLQREPYGAFTLTALSGFARRPFRFEGSMA